MPYVPMDDRYQIQFSSLDMMVDEESIARVIDAFVESLDMEKLGFKFASPAKEGRPPYPPKAMLKLYLYGHRNNIRSSRRLQKACHINIEVKWLMCGLEPDFRTISDFRKNNHTNLKNVFLEFTKRFNNLLTGFVSVDGTKINACNSKDRNFTESKLDDRIKWLEQHVEEYLRQMDQLDSEDELSGTFTSEELEAKLKEAEARLERYRAYRAYMEENNLSQISMTDIDSRLMKSRNGFAVAHNVQTVVDSETHLLADFHVTSSPTDYGQLEAALHSTKENMPDKILESVCDRGYQSPEDMVRCLESGIIPHVILPDGKDTYELDLVYETCDDPDPESLKAEDLSKCLHAGVIPAAYKDVIDNITVSEKEVRVTLSSDEVPVSPFQNEDEMRAKAAEGFFVRDPQRNIVICPTGEALRQNTVTKKDRIRYINKAACKRCPHRDQCYQGSKGFKEVEFNKDEFVKPNGKWQRANNQKPEFHKTKPKKEKRKIVTIVLRPDKRKMAQRKSLSEHPFGTIKRYQNSSYFLLKGNAKVTGEFALFALAYNLQRAVNLLGFSEVMKRMGVLFSSFRSFYCNFTILLRKMRKSDKLSMLYPVNA